MDPLRRKRSAVKIFKRKLLRICFETTSMQYINALHIGLRLVSLCLDSVSLHLFWILLSTIMKKSALSTWLIFTYPIGQVDDSWQRCDMKLEQPLGRYYLTHVAGTFYKLWPKQGKLDCSKRIWTTLLFDALHHSLLIFTFVGHSAFDRWISWLTASLVRIQNWIWFPPQRIVAWVWKAVLPNKPKGLWNSCRHGEFQWLIFLCSLQSISSQWRME